MRIKDIDKLYIANSYAKGLTFVRGEGAMLYDDEGKSYIDFGSGIAVNSIGVSNADWVKAIANQASTLSHSSNLYATEPGAMLATTLCQRTGLKKVFFSNSGAEANECAIKVARKYSFDKYGEGRFNIVTLKNSFHGRTMATLTATGQDIFHTVFNPFLDGFKYADLNIESVKQQSQNACAIMIELVQGEGGVVALEIDFVEQIQKYAKENDILLIVDEVQTGNGRCGNLYAFMEYGITPDIVTTAKGLGGGLPIGATMLGDKVKDTLTPSSHGSTFGGNPICCAGANYVLSLLNEKLFSEIKAKSQKLVSALKEMKKVKSVSGLGLMLGIECDDANKIKAQLEQKGLIVLTAKNKIRLLPSLTIDEKTLDKGIEILREVLN